VSRAILQRASDAGAPFVTCAEFVGPVPHYDWRPDGPDGAGYYRHAGAPVASDPREASLGVLREAAAAGAEFVLCPEHVGDVAGYDFRGGPDGTGYYRRPDAPPPDGREYSRMVLQRASAAGAEFVACPERVMDLPGYEFRLVGSEGVGYYKAEAEAEDAPDYNDFMATMKELGAVS